MRFIRLVAVVAVLASPGIAAAGADTYVGVVTDTMCGAGHASMNISPDAKCVRECVGSGSTYKYALLVGKNVYALSDQETPVALAGRKVRVRGVLYPKTNILKVDAITPAN